MQNVKLSATMWNLHNDGFHFRQPWVLGVEEEVRSLRQDVDKMAEEMHKMAEEIAQLKDLLTRKWEALCCLDLCL